MLRLFHCLHWYMLCIMCTCVYELYHGDNKSVLIIIIINKQTETNDVYDNNNKCTCIMPDQPRFFSGILHTWQL